VGITGLGATPDFHQGLLDGVRLPIGAFAWFAGAVIVVTKLRHKMQIVSPVVALDVDFILVIFVVVMFFVNGRQIDSAVSRAA
jgi:hypothetical protein